MDTRSPDTPNRRRHVREKATIDHLAKRVFDPEGREQRPQSPTTDSGASVEDQLRKKWNPKKGGIPIF
ncbi:MAG TPA: hypothetical protein VFQ82_02475 [Stellaceae bacterium]|nr:hypothetical protein [Stellaceae bacterium]